MPDVNDASGIYADPVGKSIPTPVVGLAGGLASLLADTGRDDEMRSRTLSGSDIGPILGRSKYRSGWDVWASKKGLLKRAPELPGSTGHLAIGTAVQLGVAALYERATGHTVEWFDRTIPGPEPWMCATPDGLIGTDGLYSGKTAGSKQVWRWGPSGSDQVPDEYALQNVWEAIVTGRNWAGYGVLLGGPVLEFRHLRLDIPPRLRDAVYGRARDWWDRYMVGDEVPPITATQAAGLWLDGMPAVGPMREPTDQERGWIYEFRKLHLAGTRTQAYDDLKAKIANAIGEGTGLYGTWGTITYKRTKDSSTTDWEKVAQELRDGGNYEEVVKRHTIVTKGHRRFLPTFTDSSKE